MTARARKPSPPTSTQPPAPSGHMFIVLPPDELAELLKADAEAEAEDLRGECIPADEVVARLRRRLAG